MKQRSLSSVENARPPSGISSNVPLLDLFDVPGVPPDHCLLDAVGQFLFRGLVETLEGIQWTKAFVFLFVFNLQVVDCLFHGIHPRT